MKANLSLAKIEIDGFGVRQLTEEDFFKECNKRGIIVVEVPLYSCDGVTYCINNQTVIGIARQLQGKDRLRVLWHEFAHAFLHVPNVSLGAWFSGVSVAGNLKDMEDEVDLFVSIALLEKKY